MTVRVGKSPYQSITSRSRREEREGHAADAFMGDPHSVTHHHESGQAEAGVDQALQEEAGRAAT